MEKLIVPFLWDMNNKSISFMIINHRYQKIISPKKYELKASNFSDFIQKADKIIKLFFKHILIVYELHPHHEIRIEYKILHHTSFDLADYHRPSERSLFVRKKFLEHYALTKSMVLPLKLSQQLRSRLKRSELAEFKKLLRLKHIVVPAKKNSYQYHLWILATHATKSNYKNVLKRLSKTKKSLIKAA